MQKLFRSLIAVGGLAGLVACGDDVSITPPNDPLLVSGAPVTAVQVGAKVQLSANKAATWTTSAANVATVDATGLVTAVAAGTASITATSTADVNEKASVTITVTAPSVRSVVVSPENAILVPGETRAFVANVDADVGVARTVTWSSSNQAVATVTAAGVVTAVTPGAATIIATSTANTAVTGAAAITVRTPTPATISVQNITITGTAGQTANVNNIAGSIDVNLNVDPGEQIVNSVDVLIDGQVACSQNLSGSQVEALRIAAAFETVEEVIVSCQINTAGITAAGLANFFNGQHVLSARANLAGGTQVATPSTQLTFNNVSGFLAVVANTNTKGGPATATNPTTGQVWRQGDVTLTLTGVTYTQGQTFTTATVTFLGCTSTNTAPTGNVFTFSYPATNNDTSCPERDDYTSAAAELPVVSSVLSGGVTGPSTILNATVAPLANPTIAVLPVILLDNQDPTVPAFLQDSIWVNAATAFAAGSLGNAPAISATTDAGVNGVTATFWASAANATSLPSGCSTTGLTAITTGSQLAETVTNTVYLVRVLYKDALGNVTCATVGRVGADFVAPTGSVSAGPSANEGFDATVNPITGDPNFAVAVADNASGFTATPLIVSMSRLNASGSTTCVIGTASSCVSTTVNQALTFDATGGADTEGYYTTSITLSDEAGNTVVLFTNRVYLVDVTAPALSGVSLPATIAGATTNTFGATATDNIDLGSVFGVTTYGAIAIQNPSQVLGTFGSPLEKSATVSYAVADWIRCVNNVQPSGITLTVSDQAGNTFPQAAAFPPANVPACGTFGNLTAPAALNTFTLNAPNYGTGKTEVDVDGASMASTSTSTVTLSAVADVTLDNSPDPATRVEFYYQNALGNWVKIGQTTGVLQQTNTTRTWTYTLVWDPDSLVPSAALPGASVPIMAIAVDAQGDAISAAGQNVLIVP
jgi:hypothetical protein